MNTNEIFKAIDIYLKRKKIDLIDRGVIAQVMPNSNQAMVRVSGSTQAQPAILPIGATMQPGDHVVLVRPEINSQWIVLTAVNQSANAIRTVPSPNDNYDIAPPTDIETLGNFPGTITVKWIVPYQQQVSIEVQTALTPNDDEAVTSLITRGAYAILPTEVPLYFRLRSISNNRHVSEWSDWLYAIPTPAQDFLPPYHLLASETYTIPVNKQVVVGDMVIDGDLFIDGVITFL